VVRPIHKQVTIPCGKYIKHRSAVYLRTAVLYLVYIKTLFGPHVSGCADDVRGPFEKFVNWRQCAVVMQRKAVTVMPSCSGGGNVVVA